MGKSRTSQMVDKLIQQRVASEQFGRHLLDQTGASQVIDEAATTAQAASTDATTANARLDAADIPVDDGFPPAAPVGLQATVFAHDVDIRWTLPAKTDYVVKTEVRAIKGGVEEKRITSKDIGMIIPGLTPDVTYTLQVRHIDAFDRISAPTSITAVPQKSIAEQITAATSVAAGQVSNLLNDPGLAAITDPGKLATAVVQRNALAMSTNPNILLWKYAEFASHDTSPAQHGTDITTNLVTYESRKWLRIINSPTPTGLDSWVFPFGWTAQDFINKYGWYIWSGEVQNRSNKVITVEMITRETDSAGINTDTKAQFTLQAFERKQISVKFQAAATNKHTMFLNINTPDTFIFVNRFMLQAIDSTKHDEPSPYVPPGLSTGSVSADLVSAWTVAAGRAIIANGTINELLVQDGTINNLKFDRASGNRIKIVDGDIVNLNVRKLEAGNLNVAVDVVAGGKISSGGAWLDNLGVTLNTFAEDIGHPSTNAADWLTPRPTPNALPSPFAGVGFFNTTSGVIKRGVTIRADGIAGASREGNISLMVTDGSQDYAATSTAHLGILSQKGGFGQIYMKQDVVIERDLDVKRHLDVFGALAVTGAGSVHGNFSTGVGNLTVGGRWNPTVVSSGNVTPGNSLTYTYPAGWPSRPFLVQAWVDTNGNGVWRPHYEGTCSIYMHPTHVDVQNNGSTTSFIRLVIYK